MVKKLLIILFFFSTNLYGSEPELFLKESAFFSSENAKFIPNVDKTFIKINAVINQYFSFCNENTTSILEREFFSIYSCSKDGVSIEITINKKEDELEKVKNYVKKILDGTQYIPFLLEDSVDSLNSILSFSSKKHYVSEFITSRIAQSILLVAPLNSNLLQNNEGTFFIWPQDKVYTYYDSKIKFFVVIKGVNLKNCFAKDNNVSYLNQVLYESTKKKESRSN